jgi:pimeloyl-ACP methyl ester carboxylesterase
MEASHAPWRVILLPGGVMPADPAYRGLLAVLGPEADARAKDLELYADDAPPPDWSFDTEVAGIERVADDANFDRFHLVGYSTGGAAALIYVLRHPDRLLSLALLEPASAGWERMTAQERQHMQRFRDLAELSDEEMMPAFQRLQLAPGVPLVPPPPGLPPWMSKRPAGLRAVLDAIFATDVDLEALERFDRPVLFALGGKSHPDYYAPMRDRLAGVFRDFTVVEFSERHHFDPPHRIEPARLAQDLRTLWSRAESEAAKESNSAAS